MSDQARRKFWQDLSRICNMDPEELLNRRDRIVEVIQKRVRHIRSRLIDADFPIVEQRMYHPVISDLDEHQALELRSQLDDSPWVIIRPSIQRVYRHPDLLCHIIGRTYRIPGSVPKTFEVIDEDYLPGELQGLTGLERSFDPCLRGKRG